VHLDFSPTAPVKINKLGAHPCGRRCKERTGENCLSVIRLEEGVLGMMARYSLTAGFYQHDNIHSTSSEDRHFLVRQTIIRSSNKIQHLENLIVLTKYIEVTEYGSSNVSCSIIAVTVTISIT
jgi:hypothetical protein